MSSVRCFRLFCRGGAAVRPSLGDYVALVPFVSFAVLTSSCFRLLRCATMTIALILTSVLAQQQHASAPHIIFALVDDLGWNYPGYHNREVKTPTLDKLATREGVRLGSHYM